MNAFMNGLYNLCTTFSPYVYMLAACALIIIGVMFIVPSEKVHNAAKTHIVTVVIGCGVVILATNLAQEISSKFVF